MITATALCKSYRGRAVLQEVSLSVSDGEFVSIMGKSGSGKSTLLSILAGNLLPDSGHVELDGEALNGMRESRLAELRRTKLGFVYQSYNLIPTLNVRDNLLLPLSLGGCRLSDYRESTEALCSLLDIRHLLSAFPHTLSGGEQQRVAIARAMLHEPRVLMLDEPTGNLDSRSTEEVMRLLRRLNTERGVTVIQVTHSAETVPEGTRVIRLHDGRVCDK